jgi:hypothetical protein
MKGRGIIIFMVRACLRVGRGDELVMKNLFGIWSLLAREI